MRLKWNILASCECQVVSRKTELNNLFPANRVTRFGEFSQFRQLLTYEILHVTKISGTLFTYKFMERLFKNRLGYILGNFFTKNYLFTLNIEAMLSALRF
jgi:hypothetical protein